MRRPNLSLVWLFLGSGTAFFASAALLALLGESIGMIAMSIGLGLAALGFAGVQWLRYGIWQVQSEILLDAMRARIDTATRRVTDVHDTMREVEAAFAAARESNQHEENHAT